MNRFLSPILLISLTIAACTGTKKLTLERDLQSQQMIAQGKDLLETGSYEKAADVFETASIRPKNQSTTTAIYLSGLAHFKRNASFPAQQQFQKLLKDYPKSKYAADARYHLALIKLKKFDENVRLEGINELFELASGSRDPELKKLAKDAASDYLFNQAGMPFLKKYYTQAKEPYKTLSFEAMIHQMGEKGKSPDSLALRYQRHMETGGQKSTFLDNLLAKETVVKPVHEPEIIKLALMMPFYWDEQSFYSMNKIPRRSKDALEFYEGFQQAVEDYESTAKKKIFVQVFDTKRDTSLMNTQLKQMGKWAPDVVVGDVYTTESRKIATWANKHQVVQMVPFSTNPKLVADSLEYTFLARPMASTHGKGMATYAAQGLMLQHVVIWTDGRRTTNSIAQKFMETFQAYGGKITLIQVDSVYDDRAQDDIQDAYKNELKDLDGIDGMYIPLSNEESAGQIISSLSIRVNRDEVKVMGTPSWGNFDLIPRQLKERFGVVFTSPYAEENDPISYRQYVAKHISKFRLPPSEVNVQGYGIGIYLLNMLEVYDPTQIPLKEFLKNAERFESAHNGIFFMRNQDNQDIHLFEYQEGEVVRIEE